jgi:KDO2-lipid IV(A) lauroyltransferase
LLFGIFDILLPLPHVRGTALILKLFIDVKNIFLNYSMVVNKIIYHLLYSLIYLITLVPFFVLYRISDLLYFLFYYILKYRKTVILQNLKNSFPEKSAKEIKQIFKAYYKYFCDLTLETFKTLSISKKEVLKRCVFDPASLQLLENLYRDKKDIILVLGHYGNWELAGSSFSNQCSYQLYVIYKPLSNKHFDRLVYKMRTRLDTKLIPMAKTYKMMKKFKSGNSATAFIADQTASPENAYWTTFLNQDTPVFRGTEIIAKKLGFPVVYISVRRLKRGYYKVFAEMLFEKPELTATGEISETHTRKLEQDILEQPHFWLWSHRRWKYKKPGKEKSS